METKELKVIDRRNTPAETKDVQGPNAMILKAMDKNYSPELIEKMMDLQERYETTLSKKAYIRAMTEFKANLPTVFKDKKNKQYNSMYASESALLNTLNPVLSKNGLSANFSFPESPVGTLSVTCIITHQDGYSESITLSGPIDTSGAKNPLQQVKSTVTYLKKATFEAITGIATSDPTADDDGNSAGAKYITEKQLSTIRDMINAKEVDVKAFCQYMKANSDEEILAKDYNKAISALKMKKKPERVPGEEG